MGSIIDKYWNAYRFTYMGDLQLIYLGDEIVYGVPFIVTKKEAPGVLNDFPESERDNLMYEKILISNYRRGDLTRHERMERYYESRTPTELN